MFPFDENTYNALGLFGMRGRVTARPKKMFFNENRVMPNHTSRETTRFFWDDDLWYIRDLWWP